MGWMRERVQRWRRQRGREVGKVRREAPPVAPEVEEPQEVVKPDQGLGPEGRPFDAILLAVVVALVGFGLVMVYSASAVMTEQRFDDGWLFLRKQSIHALAGMIAMAVGMTVDYRWYRRWAYPILLGSMGLLGVVLVAGATRNEAQRWISVGGFSFQPSEVMKIALIIYTAYSVEKKAIKIKKFSIGVLPHLVVLGLVAGLLLLQPDFGTTVMCAVLMFSLLFVAGARTGYIAMIGLIGAGAASLLILSSPYRMRRVQAFLDPHQDPLGIGYQVDQSLTAIGSGGLWGQGLGQGRSKLGYVPELWNDFIAAAVGEEWGWVGLALVVGLFAALVWRGLRVAFGAREMFGSYLAFGFTFLFGLQAAVNLSVVTGVLPNTGLTLPFISYGGTSMVICLFMVGVLLNISRAREDVWEGRRAAREQVQMEARLAKKRRRVATRVEGG